jgi:hypothetical protein
MNNWIYIGIFLDDKSKKQLMKLYPTPNGWKEYYDHMTVVYNDDTYIAKSIKNYNEHNIGKKFKLKVISVGMSDKAFAIHVELPKGIVCANKIAHITLATSIEAEGSAVDSNYITNWSKIYDNVYVTGEMKVFEPTNEKLLYSDKNKQIIIEEANVI